MKLKKIKGLTITVLLTLMLGGIVYGSEADETTSNDPSVSETTSKTKTGNRTNTIIEGIYVGTVNIGGMTRKEANAAVDKYVSNFTDKEVTISVNHNKVTTTVGNLGYIWTNSKVTKEAVKIAKTGNIVNRYKTKADITAENIVYSLELGLDEEVLKSTVEDLCLVYDKPAVNAMLTKASSGFNITKEEEGLILDVDATIAALKEQLQDWDGNGFEIAAISKVDVPNVTKEQCELVSTSPIGTYFTNFTVSDANYNRNKNIENGAKLLNGIVLYPDETYSVLENVVPFSTDNGYYEAGTFENGRVSTGIGGGICQVSTTMYNALLLAELEIVERYNHSMTVSYVPLAADAAIAEGVKDLRFKNNTDAPIYIEAICDIVSGKITFNVYGHETREEGRKIEYKSETISTTPPGYEKQEDSSKPKGYSEIISNGYTGYVAKLWKYVYQDGKKVDKILVNTSSYLATNTIEVVGTGKKEKETETESEEETTKKKSSEETTTKKKTSS